MNNKMLSYTVAFVDGRGAAEALAHTVDGSWRNEVSRFDGTHDLAIIEIPTEQFGYFEEMLYGDENVVYYQQYLVDARSNPLEN